MTEVILRNYSTDDYVALRTILEEGDLFVPAWDTEERLKKRITQREDSIIVATNNDEIVGCIYIVDDIIPLIFRLAVKKEYRKKGIGKMLIKEAEKRLKENGHTEVAIFVHEENDELKKWYGRQGYEQFSLLRCMVKEL